MASSARKKRTAGVHPPFNRILIANRGEIACRIIATARRLGIETVAVYTEPDRSALHVRDADLARPIVSSGGVSGAGHGYLDAKQIMEIARKTKADAIHPGYGFLAENAEFAETVRGSGLVFIGPTSQAMRLLGNKVSARDLARKLKLPIVPGLTMQDEAALARFTRKVGYPLMIKAAAGGGGRGMRRVYHARELPAALKAAANEARASFGDETLFVEKLIECGRHIEVQILGDHRGAVMALSDRDCSLQRKHQKLIEEAPAPGLTPALRKRIAAAAIKLCRAGGYSNAGTVEFLLAPDSSFYFLEVNSRLQVEHPVTEAITGVDLVELQIRIAAGEAAAKIASLQKFLRSGKPRGHAIECRLCAENPDQDFAPATGRITRLDLPRDGCRIDTGFLAGDGVTHYYDSLLAKLIVWAPDRSAACASMQRLLASSTVTGVQTNLALLNDLIGEESFRQGTHHVGTLPALIARSAGADGRRVVLAALALLSDTGKLRDRSNRTVWDVRDQWRAGAADPQARRAQEQPRRITINGVALDLTLSSEIAAPDPAVSAEPPITLHLRQVDGGRRLVEKIAITDPPLAAEWQFLWRGAPHVMRRYRDGDRIWLCGTLGQHVVNLNPPRKLSNAGGKAAAGTAEIRSPLPGTVLELLVAPGDQVVAGQTLVTIESMKMEHALRAPAAGRVRALNAKPGMIIDKDHLLISLDP